MVWREMIYFIVRSNRVETYTYVHVSCKMQNLTALKPSIYYTKSPWVIRNFPINAQVICKVELLVFNWKAII